MVAGDSDYLPPEEAAAQEAQRHTSVSNLTSPLKKEASGEYDQKLARVLIRAHHIVPPVPVDTGCPTAGSRSREAL